MKTTTFTLLIGMFLALNCYSQSTATDFTSTDCEGNTHHLFSELENGKVIVIAWVMPCLPCGVPATSAYGTVLSYQSSHPDRVKFYLVDDYANTSCDDLQIWATSNSMDSCTIFSDPQIDMADYGPTGMPKIVVLGGENYEVFYNKNNSNAAQGVASAIDQALSTTSTNNINNNNIELSFSPNPSSIVLNIDYELNLVSIINMDIFNMLGQKVVSEQINSQSLTGDYQLNTSTFSEGTYFINISTKGFSKVIKFNVVH